MNLLIWLVREPVYVLIGLPIIVAALYIIGRQAKDPPPEGRA